MAAPSIKNFKPQPKLPVNNFQKIVDGITQNSSLAAGMAAARPFLPAPWWIMPGSGHAPPAHTKSMSQRQSAAGAGPERFRGTGKLEKLGFFTLGFRHKWANLGVLTIYD
jgi:hypothetical protein